MESLPARLEFAREIATRAGAIALARSQSAITVEWKRDQSPVTIADREAERALRDAIEARFPAEGIVGEEFGVTRPGTRRTWYLDPIDGTRSFVRGVPLWGTMVGWVEDGDPVLGVVHLPALGETIWAARGEG
jgi:histidinol-phosphatase